MQRTDVIGSRRRKVFLFISFSGYSKGLTLLLLGQRNVEKPMRVTPWNQYQLVDKETDPDLQLASGKNRLVRGCASFVCFGRAAAGLESPSPLKVGPSQNQEVLPGPLVFDESKDLSHSDSCVGDDNSNRKIISRKSSLKKPEDSFPVTGTGGGGCTKEHKALCENNDYVACQMERRKVQWTDTSGGELFQIREFDMSENGSDNEFGHGNDKTCSCSIM